MSSLHLRHSHLLLDTCCLINLHVSGALPEILGCLPAMAVVVTDVRLEAQRFDVQLYADQGALMLDDLTGQEYELFLNLLANGDLDDGEAAVGAVAISRTWAIATDDQLARDVFLAQAPHIQLLTTPELLQHWATLTGCEAALLRQTLQRVELEGRFRPGPQHPLHTWWRRAVAS